MQKVVDYEEIVITRNGKIKKILRAIYVEMGMGGGLEHCVRDERVRIMRVERGRKL